MPAKTASRSRAGRLPRARPRRLPRVRYGDDIEGFGRRAFREAGADRRKARTDALPALAAGAASVRVLGLLAVRDLIQSSSRGAATAGESRRRDALGLLDAVVVVAEARAVQALYHGVEGLEEAGRRGEDVGEIEESILEAPRVGASQDAADDLLDVHGRGAVGQEART